MAMKVTDRDLGWREMMRTVQSASVGHEPRVVVGILGEKAAQVHSGGATLVEVASFNELGTRTTPARSFIRETVDIYARDIATLAKNLMQQVLARQRGYAQALGILGSFVKGKIIARINAGIGPANAPSTIAKKGSSKPLIDKGQLKGAVDYEVRAP